MSDRHPSPLRPSQPEEGGPDAEARRQWYQWAESQRLQPHQEVAVRAALDLLKTGATATAAAAAGHVAASRANIQHVTQLQAEVAWIQSVIDDLKRQDAPAALIERYQARYAAVDAAMKLYWKPEAQAAAQAGVQSARHAREAEELQRRNAEAVLREEADARARQAEELKRQLEREAWLRRAAAGATAPSPVIEPAAPAASVAERPAAPAVPGPSAPAQPPGPPRLSFQEFLSEHSIMIVSYTGAFLLFIATLLFELYTINFNGELRFAGVAGLDLIFGAAGIACLRSQRLRLVGHTYVAIFALLAPLVFVAAYVFLNLQSKGISTDQAFLVSGLACCVLYIVLALRLRLHAYGVLALLSLPVAWLGAIDLLELGAWRGPALSPLALVYTLVLFESPRLKAAGDRFSRFALPFVHASAAASLVLTLYYLATAHGDWIPWVLASTAGGLAVSYIAFRALGGATYGSTIALSALTVAAAAAAYDSRLGDWRAATLSPMVALYTIVHLRPRWLGSRAQLFSADAYFFVHIAAGLVLVGIFAELAQAGHWIPWSITVALAGVAAGYALNRGVGGREEEAIGALLAFGPMWVAGVHDAGLGVWGGVAVSPLLAIYAMADRRSFSRYAEYFVHASALAAVLFVVLSASSFHSADWPAATAFAAVTAGYLVHRLVGGREPSGSLGLLTFGVAWLLAVDALGFSPWRGAALAPLAAVYSILASRRWKIIPSSATYFIHAALLAAAVVIGADMLSRNQWIPAVAAASAALFAIAYLLDTALNRREESALIALVLFGAAWVAGADALQLGWWRGATVAPLAVLYAVMAFRGARLGAVGELLSRHARHLVHAATAAALALTFGDMLFAGHWIPWTGPATLAVITVAYLLFALLGQAVDAVMLCQVAFGVTWTLASTDLHLGVWRGPSVTPLVALYGLIAYRGRRSGPVGALFARYGFSRIHAAAAIALALTAYSVLVAGAWVPWAITATLIGLALAYLILCFAGGPVETAVLGMAAFGFAWAGASHDLGLGQWRSTAVAVLPALYALAAFRGSRLGAAGVNLARHALLFVYAGGALAFLVLMYELGVAGAWIPWITAATFMVLAAAYLAAGALGGDVEIGFLLKLAFGVGWVAAAHDLVPGAWWPAAVTPLLALYSLVAFRGARAGRVGEKVSHYAVLFVDAAAVVVLLLAVIEVGMARDWLPWSLTVAAFAVSAAFLLYVWLGGDVDGAIVSMASLLIGWAGLAQDLNLHSWRGSVLVALGLLFVWITFEARHFGRVGTVFARWSEVFIHLAAALGIGWVVFDPENFLASAPIAAVLTAAAILYAVYAWFSGRQPALLVTAVAVTLAALFESNALGLSSIYVSTELTLLAAAGAVVAGLTGDRVFRYGLRILMAVQLVGVAALTPDQHWIQAADLLLATAVVTWVARGSRTPAWLLFAAALFAVDWYWFAQGLPAPPKLTDGSWIGVYGPLPLVFGLVGLGLRSVAGRRWAWPLYASGISVAVAVLTGGLSYQYFELVGALLLAYSILVYATGGVENLWEAAIVAGVTTAIGFGFLLYAAKAATDWYPVAVFATSAVLYGLQVPWELRFPRSSEWIQSHRLTGLGGAAISSLSSFAFFGTLNAHDWGALAAAVGLVGFGALVVIDGRRNARPEFDYLGAVLMSLAGLWVAFYFGARNLEWYVILPGAVVIASGLRLPYDKRVRLPQIRLIAQVLTGVGMVLVLGTSAVLTVLEPPNAWIYTSALVVESVAALLLGIGFKSRVLVVGGSAGVAVSALRAIFVGITQGWLPVWAVFFVVSIVLLGLGAALALLRDRLPEARLRFNDAWRDWN